MSVYSIKELGLISGIKPHTIRIWEKRYNILKPLRSDTNIRYYDDDQLKKLLNVCALINSGMKISAIGALSQKHILVEMDKIIAAAFKKKDQFDTIINQLLIAISTFDEAHFEKIFFNATQKFGLTKTYLNIIYPTLVRIGLMWTKSDIMPAQEHFFSNLFKQKLYAAIDVLPIPKSSNQTWVLFLNPQEEHEIGLLFANYILRKQGKKVVYLGPKVPYDNLRLVIQQFKTTHVYTFFTKKNEEEIINSMLDDLNATFKKIVICFSGNKNTIEKIPLTKNRMCVKDIHDLLEIVNH